MNKLEFIELVVCCGEEVNPTYLHCKTRQTKVKEARQIIMTLAQKFNISQSDAGAYFGLDHATAYHAKNIINNLIETEKEFCKKVKKYEDNLAPIKESKPNYLSSIISIIEKEVFEAEKEIDCAKITLDDLKDRVDMLRNKVCNNLEMLNTL